MGRLTPVATALVVLMLGTFVLAQKPTPKEHDEPHSLECARCRSAYDKAMDHTLARLRQASFPAKMIMGWTMLADGQQKKELEYVINEATRWKSRVGERKPHNHRRNWYPALAGVLIAEYAKYEPSRELRKAMQALVDHFVAVQEKTGGWYKWHEGAFKDRLDYPVKDLGMLDAMIYGFLCTARAHGVLVPAEAFARAEACLGKLLGSRGISYGTGSRGGDPTGARGAFAMNGLLYSRNDKHAIAKTYEKLLPRCIPKMNQGHHVGGLHCLGVTIGCHLLGTKVYDQLLEKWLDHYINEQKPDGGMYVGDDEDAGGEVGLLGQDDASTAALALMILLRDRTRLVPGQRPEINWLALTLEKPESRKLAKTVGLAASGQLGKALAIAKRVRSSGGSTENEKMEAGAIAKAIVAHGQACLGRARTALEERDVLHAVEVAQLVAKSFPRHDLGTEAKALVKKTKTHAELKRELAAQVDFEKAMALSLKKGLRKARSAFLEIVKRYDGTRAAERAREVVE